LKQGQFQILVWIFLFLLPNTITDLRAEDYYEQEDGYEEEAYQEEDYYDQDDGYGDGDDQDYDRSPSSYDEQRDEERQQEQPTAAELDEMRRQEAIQQAELERQNLLLREHEAEQRAILEEHRQEMLELSREESEILQQEGDETRSVYELGIKAEREMANVVDEEERAAIKFLKEKLTKKNGRTAKVVVLTPLDYTNMNLSASVATTIHRDLMQYGVNNSSRSNYVISSLTVEAFRKAKIRTKADILVLSVLKPQQFELFMYDSRQPYNIFAYSQELPDPTVQPFTLNAAQYYTRLLVRRVLYLYLQDYYLELPRIDQRPTLVAEVPRWVANAKVFKRANKNIISNFYASASVGAALAKGSRGDYWGTNIISGSVAYRFMETSFIEAGFSAFTLNMFSLGFKYYIEDKSTPFLFGGGGVAVGLAFNKHTIDWQQSLSPVPLGGSAIMGIPSLSVLFPIGDAYLKAETQVLIGSGQMVLTFLPGLLLKF